MSKTPSINAFYCPRCGHTTRVVDKPGKTTPWTRCKKCGQIVSNPAKFDKD